jgi:hypothetical protein
VAALAIIANVELWQRSREPVTADDQIRPAAQGAISPSNPAPSSPPQAEDTPPAITGCLQRWQQQGRPLLAADDTMKQWRLRIVAMNRLIAGEITLEQAADFWNQTRIGAMRRVERFQVEYAGYRDDAASCEGPDAEPEGSSSASDRHRRCAQAIRASDRVLEVACR